MNKQQTAVDYFEYELTKLDFDEITQENCWFYIIPIYEQAKEIEKEQIMDAHIESGARLEDISIESAEQYYNETYGGE